MEYEINELNYMNKINIRQKKSPVFDGIQANITVIFIKETENKEKLFYKTKSIFTTNE